MEITFLGATGTVTGSRYLVTSGRTRILVDCGLFQGLKQLRLRNREPFPVDPASIDAVVLTHAHLDHTGYLPLLIRNGFRGPIYATPATRDLCSILLPDSGHLQEEEAREANRHGYSKHDPALPLYTLEDAERALRLIGPREFDAPAALNEQLAFRLLPAGHILGAASVEVACNGTLIAFSGDLGRPDDPLMRAPSPPARADYLVIESTYGDRLHDALNPEDELAEVFARTFSRGGVVVMPCFGVGRAQEILYYIARLKEAGRMPGVPVYLDSPMAISVTDLYRRHMREHRLTLSQLHAIDHAAFMTRTLDESQAIAGRRGPKLIIAGSGMATGGRVLHHLALYASDPHNTIALVGFQAAGTRGAALEAREPAIKLLGEYVPMHAEIASISSLSAHADYNETLRWLAGMARPPARTFVTHGEPAAADALRRRIAETLGWRCDVPAYLDAFDLPERGERERASQADAPLPAA